MLPRFFSEVFGEVWLIDPATAEGYMPLLISLYKGTWQKNGIDYSQERVKNNLRYVTTNGSLYTISDYGQGQPPEKAPKNSIAVMNITDVISKYDVECGPAGMKTKGNILQRCYETDNIKGIMLSIDSGGGSGAAMNYLNSVIAQRNKPVIAFVDDMAASAAMGIAVSTDWVVANNKLARVGSIGTYMTIADFSKAWEMEGIRLIEVYADKSKDKNKDYYDALKGDLTGIKVMVNEYNEGFLQHIKSSRGLKLKEDEKVWGTGKLFNAEKGVEIGLVDEIATWEETVYSFANSLNLA